MKFIYLIDYMDEQPVYVNAYHISQVYAGSEKDTSCIHLTDRTEPLVVKCDIYALMELIHE